MTKIEVIRTATGLHVDVPDEYVGATEKIEVALIHGWMPTWTLHKSAIGTVYYEIGWKGDFEDIPLPERETIQPEDK